MSVLQTKRLLVVEPRGFCAGVERAIEVVERLLTLHGAPVYVRREIVHNKAVVEDFQTRGVVFVDELDQIPDQQRVVFSAHGISPAIRQEAERRQMPTVDATCPLVTRVHNEVRRYVDLGHHVVLIGHAGHDEVLGTMGEAPGFISLVSEVQDVENLEFALDADVAYVTQTTLSVDETQAIVAALRARFLNLVEPRKTDICYATQNRQDAVKTLVAQEIEHLLVVGSQSSSNSRRLCEVARNLGVPGSLIDGPEDIDLESLTPLRTIGLTAGASAPEHLVQAVIKLLGQRDWQPETVVALQEDVSFRLPKEL